MSDDVSIPNTGYRGRRVGRHGRLRSGINPATQRLMMFAGGLCVVLGGLIGASMFFGHRSTTIPIVAADTSPIRIKPANPGGMQIDGAENDVFAGGVDSGNVKLAPAAEAPNPDGMNAGAVTPLATAPAPLPPAAAQPTPPRPLAVPAPAAIAPAKPPATPQAPAAAMRMPSASPGRAATVQLGALTTEQAARNEWQQLVRRMPDLLNGRQPNFSRAEREGHTFWRVRTSGFSDLPQARAFCEHVRAKGGACSVADF